ncbi:MAG: sigma-70 family RNA polymerase sigma factor, partial [Actinomycetota bacterium]
MDSSAAAALLKEDGYEVVGCFMRLGSEDPDEIADGYDNLHAQPCSTDKQPRKHKQGCCSVNDAPDARLVAATNAGDAEAFGLLYDRWFDRVHDLARRITRDDEAAADVAQDAFVTAWNRLDGLRDPDAFGGWLLRITRNRALDRVRSAGRVQLEEQGDVSGRVDDAAAADRMVDLDAPEAVAEDRELQALVLEAAEALGERDATALHLQLRHGLTPAEVGDVLGMNRNAANQLVYRVRDRLGDAVRGRVLWRDGRPRCERLRRELDDKGITTFDRQAVRVSNRHAQQCDECEERRRLRLAPAALFRAVPVAVAPVSIKQHAAQALAEQGVPMVGSVHGTGPGGGPAAERSWARR